MSFFKRKTNYYLPTTTKRNNVLAIFIFVNPVLIVAERGILRDEDDLEICSFFQKRRINRRTRWISWKELVCKLIESLLQMIDAEKRAAGYSIPRILIAHGYSRRRQALSNFIWPPGPSESRPYASYKIRCYKRLKLIYSLNVHFFLNLILYNFL